MSLLQSCPCPKSLGYNLPQNSTQYRNVFTALSFFMTSISSGGGGLQQLPMLPKCTRCTPKTTTRGVGPWRRHRANAWRFSSIKKSSRFFTGTLREGDDIEEGPPTRMSFLGRKLDSNDVSKNLLNKVHTSPFVVIQNSTTRVLEFVMIVRKIL